MSIDKREAEAIALLLTGIGLCVFEIVGSLDNAIVNANILAQIKSDKARRFFVTWGMLISVGLVRGLLPFVIYYIPNYKLGLRRAMTGFWSGDPVVVASVSAMAPYLLMAGGMFLLLLFLHWFMAEAKEAIAYPYEDMFHNAGGAWFFAVSGVLLAGTLWWCKTHMLDTDRAMNTMLAAAIGTSVFYIADGFKEHAQNMEKQLTAVMQPWTPGDPVHAESVNKSLAMSDWSKVLFLEVIDATFSTDGVVGAFAFTMVVPFILVGNGIGAYVVRRLTLSNVDKLRSYELLKNGAMYAIGLLGAAMAAEGFGVSVPFWVSPLVTFSCVGLFFALSVRANNRKVVAV